MTRPSAPDLHLETEFGADRPSYVRARPPYPDAVIDFLVGATSPPTDIVDLGAGTGLAAGALAQRGHVVMAVEPDETMARELRGRTGVCWIKAHAEATGLPSQCADHVVCAQSFHWFDAVAALAEVRRLLRPQGVLSVLWRSLDLKDPTTRRFSAFRIEMLGPPKDRVTRLSIDSFVQSQFRPTAEAHFAAPFRVDAQTVLDYLASQRNCARHLDNSETVAAAFRRTFGLDAVVLCSDINVIRFCL